MGLIAKIFGIVNLLFWAVFCTINAQTLSFEPDEITLSIGETFPVKVFINTENQIINVISAKINFDPEKIKIGQINQGGSVFSIIPTNPDISTYEKTASFTGAKPNGFNSQKALIAQIEIKPISIGASEMYFRDDTVVYLNDGLGTEVKAKGGRLKIKAGKAASKETKIAILSTTHPDESRWYNFKNAAILWQINTDSEYSYEVSRDYFKEPDNIPDKPIGQITLKNLSEGISYFHLKECFIGGNCGKKNTFRLQIDTVPPQFETTFFELEGQRFLSIFASDENSGVDKIEQFIFRETLNNEKGAGVIGQGQWQKILLPYPINEKNIFEPLILKITDRAGNYQMTKISLAKRNYFMIGLFVLLILIIAFYIILKIRAKRKPPYKMEKPPFLKNDNLSSIMGQMGKGIFLILLVLFLPVFSHFAFAQTSQETIQDQAHANSNWRILFDGKLTDHDGKLVPDGKYNASFAIFDAPEEGNESWRETFVKENRIKVVEGNFQAMLGQTSPIDLDFNQKDYFLSVSIGGSNETPVWDKEMTPRRKIITLEKLLSGEEVILSEGELIDVLIKEFESLNINEARRPDRSIAAFIEFIKNKLKAPDGSTIIVNLDTLQKILEKAAAITQIKEVSASETSGGFLDFFIRIINTLIEKIAQIFEKIGQIFTYLINISDKVDKIYDIISKPEHQAFAPAEIKNEPALSNPPTQIFGSATIEKGKNSLFVQAPQISSASKIFITFKDAPPFVWWISEKKIGQGFYIALYPQALENISFDWWIVNDLNFNESPLPSPSELPQNQKTEEQKQSLQPLPAIEPQAPQTPSPPDIQTPTTNIKQEQFNDNNNL